MTYTPTDSRRKSSAISFMSEPCEGDGLAELQDLTRNFPLRLWDRPYRGIYDEGTW
jgi:hypothetical protein